MRRNSQGESLFSKLSSSHARMYVRFSASLKLFRQCSFASGLIAFEYFEAFVQFLNPVDGTLTRGVDSFAKIACTLELSVQ